MSHRSHRRLRLSYAQRLSSFRLCHGVAGSTEGHITDISFSNTDYTNLHGLLTKTSKTPSDVCDPYRSLCAKCYGSAFKNKLLRQFQTSYHITTVIPNLRRKNLQKRMKNRVVRILDALWQFCRYVFVPQRRPADG